ncbi:hypothetical protein TIFTF001_038714 [Ficus carica]|uniref:Transposase (putative) gypsy type domain-containing protein n=1 Tax=Ficus carica TaxID=3494 RepID=A0AA88EB09_FICCA|nr:hypothetical protein TIFTF001_038714 [Ficus carica]
MDKQKEVIDDVDVEWTSTDSSDSSLDNEELMSTIRRSKFEHEFQHSQMGVGTSNKPPRRLSTESFLRTSNPRSVLTESDLSDIRGRYGFPNKVQLCLPFKGERADSVSEGWICMYTIFFECGLRLPLTPLLIQCMHHYQLAIPQLMPNRKRIFLVLIVLAEEASVELSVDDVLAIYNPQENFKDHGRYSMYPMRKKQVVGEMKNADRYWQDRYFFMLVNKKSMGDLANDFYPLWGTLRKELKKPPPKALLFEEKLERLLALPNRERDDIQVPKRARKEAELAAAAKGRMSDKVAEQRDRLKAEFATRQEEEGGRKAQEESSCKEEPKDTQTSVDIARQMFSDADAEIMNQGPPQSHMDDIMWETMKINVRTMGLFYRLSDKVGEQRDRLKDLVEKDIARGEKLLDIERKFGDGCSEGGHICDGNLGQEI